MENAVSVFIFVLVGIFWIMEYVGKSNKNKKQRKSDVSYVSNKLPDVKSRNRKDLKPQPAKVKDKPKEEPGGPEPVIIEERVNPIYDEDLTLSSNSLIKDNFTDRTRLIGSIIFSEIIKPPPSMESVYRD